MQNDVWYVDKRGPGGLPQLPGLLSQATPPWAPEKARLHPLAFFPQELGQHGGAEAHQGTRAPAPGVGAAQALFHLLMQRTSVSALSLATIFPGLDAQGPEKNFSQKAFPGPSI